MNVLVYDQQPENIEILFNLLENQPDINCEFCSFVPVAKNYDLLITNIENLNHCNYIKNIPIVVIGKKETIEQQSNKQLNNSSEISILHDEYDNEIISIDFSKLLCSNIIENNQIINDNQNCIYIKPPVLINQLINIINAFKNHIKQKQDIKNQDQKLLEYKPQKIWFKYSLDKDNTFFLFKTLESYRNLINSEIFNAINLIISEFIIDLCKFDKTILFTISLFEDKTSLTLQNILISNDILFFIQINAHDVFLDQKSMTITWFHNNLH